MTAVRALVLFAGAALGGATAAVALHAIGAAL